MRDECRVSCGNWSNEKLYILHSLKKILNNGAVAHTAAVTVAFLIVINYFQPKKRNENWSWREGMGKKTEARSSYIS
jgi:hypothetical protein